MFGCIAAGRPVQTNIVQIDQTHYIFELTEAQTINHIVVFLLSGIFPPGYGATVHFLWPSESNAHWVFLGILTDDKPSAIFKLGGSKNNATKSMDVLMDDGTAAFQPASGKIAQLGISIEPLHDVLNQQEMHKNRSTFSNALVRSNDNQQNEIQIIQNLIESMI